ncbi:MAG: replicative helicase loader/inhibitor [bacterium]
MNKTELLKVLTFISNSYSNKFKFPKDNQEENKILIETWYSFLHDYDYEVVKVAVKKIVVNKPQWPPTVGELVNAIEDLSQPEENKITGGEAWSMALEAVRKYGYYDMKGGMESLPPLIRKTIECFGGYGALCHSKTNDSYARQNFISIYEELSKKRAVNELLPPSIKKESKQLQKSMSNKKGRLLN